MKGSKRNLMLIVMTAWMFIVGIFACWFEMDTRREEMQRALNTANSFFQQVVINRQWNASHGGVYVPITPQTQPNEYLPAQGRDLTADNGLKLTKVNPSYMTRQIAELAIKNEKGIHLHITSLKPIRPENKATEWEERWLKSFEQGVKEQGEFFEDGNTTWFRYMAPLTVGPECLKCHAQQGYKEGDIRGGISVSIPYPSHTHLHLVISYGSVAVIGLIFIFIGVTLYKRKQRLFEATFNSPLPTNVIDKNHTILQANESYWAQFGALPDNQKTIKCYKHRPGKACHTENCPLTQIMGGASTYTYDSIKEIAGVPRHFIITAKPLLDAKGKVVGTVENFQDITERKQAEEALEKSSNKIKMFAYFVAHDLKNPAIAILGLTKHLQKHYRNILDKKGGGFCDQILKSSEQIADLVETINVYISTKETPITVAGINVKDILQLIREEFSAQLTIRQIRWSEPEHIPEINADRLSILRVMRNFIDNALKYGGDELSEIEIRYKESDEFHILSVKDDGIGLKQEESNGIFNSFSRKKTSIGVKGTGLGLAIVKEIAEQHRGHVSIEHGRRKGITFSLSISKYL